MASEEQEMLQKISALAGQINRHKNQQTVAPVRSANTSHHSPVQPPHTARYSGRGSYAPYPTRGRGHPNSRGRPVPAHRNRTLVLNATQTGEASPITDGSGTTTPTQSWVSKSDRHLQLINPAVYEKVSMDRSKALQETRQQRLKHKDQRDKIKLANYLRLTTAPHRTVSGSTIAIPATASPIVTIEGVRFKVSQDGNKLIRINDVDNLGLNTPKKGDLGGVLFHRSKNGNMYRSGIVKAQRNTGRIKKVDELCKVFSTTGSCSKGPQCRYRHDPNKLAVCKDYLMKGSCPNGSDCDLSHDLTPQRTPTCLHFSKGNCTNADCRYIHAHVSVSALLCRAFGQYGFCDKGSTCPERHIMSECPDYSNTGVCHTKNCRLMHRDRAVIMRKHAISADTDDEMQELGDLSSDEEGFDSDDVDSDDMEVFGSGNEDDNDILMQQDFVHL